MSNILLVPVHLDALVLDRDQMVVETTADFTRIPYCAGKYDINPDIANISEEIVSKSFQNENLLLKAGIHLHWSLPDALTKARYVRGAQDFPPVPNRWLVTRCNDKGVVQKEWLVESDYLYPPYNDGDNAPASTTDGVAMPFITGSGQPYRLMGRSFELAQQIRDENSEYYPKLTAVGYGEPTFAAFYPNCYSVFGFYDEDYDGKNDGRQYYLSGWYSKLGDDVLRTDVKDAEDLKDAFKWSITPAEQPFPKRMVCYARLTLGKAKSQLMDERISVAVGNTGTEALSACLALKLNGNAAKAIAEDQLEAIHLAAALEHRRLDVGAKFLEARHENGFTAVPGGTLWTVRAETPANSDASSEITLPPELGNRLNVLNKRQRDYDRASQEIESLRVQLFSDWYKYMLCAYPPEDTRDAYPDVDRVASYIASRVEMLNQRIERAGTLTVEVSETGRVVAKASEHHGSLLTLAEGLANAINNLQSFIDPRPGAGHYKLKQTSGPRYWQPTEPSILLEGAPAKATLRHGQDAPGKTLLETQLLPDVDETTDPAEKNLRRRIRAKIDDIGKAPGADKNFAFKQWDGQPWNPFLLEWQIEVFPVANKSNIDPLTGHYSEEFITENYWLAENATELSFKKDKGATTSAANLYIGRSILTPHARTQLMTRMEEYFEKEVLPLYYGDTASASGAGRDMKAIRKWYEAHPKFQSAGATNDPNLTAFRAWDAVAGTESLSQAISGFNDALLMHKQTLQLHIADPLGFTDYQPFAKSVGSAVSASIYSAPEPQNDFNPIRSGAMKVHRLRLVDTFGQNKAVDVSQILPSEPLNDGNDGPLVNLPPRLMQPARVNFRWLSADTDEEEMNDHPATTPICGWVLANNLDWSLMIYDNTGQALGSLVKKQPNSGPCGWVPAPGGLGVKTIKDISNRHLRKMVAAIEKWGGEFLDDFIPAIESAIENIEPENFAHHQDLALLMGRPLALVRASVNLELKGLPATHQGWNEFRQDMQRDGRDDNGFTRVRFPIRIGAYKQFNDGTVGYWREDGEDYEQEVFFAPQSDKELLRANHLKTHRTHPEDMVFFQTVKSEPQLLSLLIDPRGLVHATTGVLPVKAINIPPDHYSAALQSIEITFLSTPVLTDAGKIHLPLPEEAGYQWSWLQQNYDGVWSEVSSHGVVRKEAFAVFQPNAEAVWTELLARGWIERIDADDDTRANVTPKDQRRDASLKDFKEKTAEIEDILDRAHIGPVDPTAKFGGQQEIREGWLKLSPAADVADS